MGGGGANCDFRISKSGLECWRVWVETTWRAEVRTHGGLEYWKKTGFKCQEPAALSRPTFRASITPCPFPDHSTTPNRISKCIVRNPKPETFFGFPVTSLPSPHRSNTPVLQHSMPFPNTPCPYTSIWASCCRASMIENWVKIKGTKGTTSTTPSPITFCLFKGIKRIALMVSKTTL